MKILPTAMLIATLSSTLLANAVAPPLPQEADRWLDGKSLSWNQLKGKVVLVNVWTFGCWNSYRSLPWITSLQKRFPELAIIGVHSPEFPWEKDRSRLKETIKKYGVQYPQLLDDRHEYWNALNNRYWPAFYIVDKQGMLRTKFVGETHEGDAQAQKIEHAIAALMREQQE